MIKTLFASVLFSSLVGATAFAITPQETLSDACVEAGNDRTNCDCAANAIVDELNDDETDFMLATLDADTSDPNAVMALAVEHDMTIEAMMAMGQKMNALSPVVSEQCGIDDLG